MRCCRYSFPFEYGLPGNPDFGVNSTDGGAVISWAAGIRKLIPKLSAPKPQGRTHEKEISFPGKLGRIWAVLEVGTHMAFIFYFFSSASSTCF